MQKFITPSIWQTTWIEVPNDEPTMKPKIKMGFNEHFRIQSCRLFWLTGNYAFIILVATIFHGSKNDTKDQRVSVKNVSDLEFTAISRLLQNR